MIDGCEQIERIRRQRGVVERDLSIGGLVKATAESATTSRRKLGSLIEAWQEVVPDDLVRQTTIASLRGGTATVQVDTASALYELDRFLRAGGQQALRQQYRGTLARVRLKRRISP